MSYFIDLTTISIDEFKLRIIEQKMYPSQKILLDNIDENFSQIKDRGISNIQQLKEAIKTKEKVAIFSKEASIDNQYVTMLRREVNSYHPKPRKIIEFKSIKEDTKQKLLSMGIKDTAKLYDWVNSKKARAKLIDEINIDSKQALSLTKLCDVSRLRYVNPAFAELLMKSSYDTVEKIKSADYRELYKELKNLNKDNKYYSAHLGESDMEFLVRDKANVSIVMEFDM